MKHYIKPTASIVNIGVDDLMLVVPIAGSGADGTTPEESDAKAFDIDNDGNAFCDEWDDDYQNKNGGGK